MTIVWECTRKTHNRISSAKQVLSVGRIESLFRFWKESKRVLVLFFYCNAVSRLNNQLNQYIYLKKQILAFTIIILMNGQRSNVINSVKHRTSIYNSQHNNRDVLCLYYAKLIGRV